MQQSALSTKTILKSAGATTPDSASSDLADAKTTLNVPVLNSTPISQPIDRHNADVKAFLASPTLFVSGGNTPTPPKPVPPDRKDVLEKLLDLTQNPFDTIRGIRCGDSKSNGTVAPEWMRRQKSVFPYAKPGDTIEHLVATAPDEMIAEFRKRINFADAQPASFAPWYKPSS